MPEIHRVADKPIRPADDNVLWRSLQAWATAAMLQTIGTREPVLHISPKKKNEGTRLKRERAPAHGEFKSNDADGNNNKCTIGSALEPPQNFLPGLARFHRHRIIPPTSVPIPKFALPRYRADGEFRNQRD